MLNLGTGLVENAEYLVNRLARKRIDVMFTVSTPFLTVLLDIALWLRGLVVKLMGLVGSGAAGVKVAMGDMRSRETYDCPEGGEEPVKVAEEIVMFAFVVFWGGGVGAVILPAAVCNSDSVVMALLEESPTTCSDCRMLLYKARWRRALDHSWRTRRDAPNPFSSSKP
jgi:hypothetical protein